MRTLSRRVPAALLGGMMVMVGMVHAQDESLSPNVNAGIGKDAGKAMERFDSPNRDVIKQREQILEACALKPGMAIADVGAGSGFHARLFAEKVSSEGKVYAVEIFQEMLDHIEEECKKQKVANLSCVLGTTTSTGLEKGSADVIFTSNTYHHFEYPFKMLASIHQALRPGGRLIIIDDKNKSNHVRASQAEVVAEVQKAGFSLIDQREFSKRNFIARFEKK